MAARVGSGDVRERDSPTQQVSSVNNQGVASGDVYGGTIIGQQTNSYYGGSNTPPATSNPSLKAFHVPRPQNVCFSARASEIDRMHEILCPEHGTSTEKRQETCLLYGTSGMGKTQAALEFAYKHRSCYDLVYWVHCETESAYLTDMLEIAQSLRLKLGDKAKDDAIAKAVRSWFGNTEPTTRWLLVFDNVVSSKTLSTYLPSSGHGSILITSQDRSLSAQLVRHKIRLEPFSNKDARGCMLSYLAEGDATPGLGGDENGEDNDDDGNMSQLCGKLGCLPLAVAQVAGYMAEYSMCARDVLDDLKSPSSEWEIYCAETDTTYDYPKVLGKAWDMSLEKLSENEFLMLRILSMLSADGVPKHIIARTTRPGSFDETVSRLSRLQLIFQTEILGTRCIAMHRALQRIILQWHRTGPVIRHGRNGLTPLEDTFMLAVQSFDNATAKGDFMPVIDLDVIKSFMRNPTTLSVLSLHEVFIESEEQLLGRLVDGPTTNPSYIDALFYFASHLALTSAYILGSGGDISVAVSICDTAEKICYTFPCQRILIQWVVFSTSTFTRFGQGVDRQYERLFRHQKAMLHIQTLFNRLLLHSIDPARNGSRVALFSETWAQLSWLLADYGFYQEAVGCIDLYFAINMRLNQDCGNAVYWYCNQKSLYLVALGRVKEAKELMLPFQKLIELQPEAIRCGASQAWLVLAMVYLRDGNWPEADNTVERYLQHSLAAGYKNILFSFNLRYLRSVVEERMGDKEKAIQTLTELLKVQDVNSCHPMVIRVKYHLGRLLDETDNEAKEEADTYRKDAERARGKIGLLTGDISENPEYPDNLTPTEIHDLMVPMLAGRTTFIQPRPWAAINTSERCKTLLNRITSAFPEEKPVPLDKLMEVLQHSE